MARTEGETIYPKPRTIDDPKARTVDRKASDTKPAIILDMGEASREQGFRLNGCR